ncbi:hypothetical protein [Microvirga solisilvae]|uniref:hypothetical protein n=1 Tax=Microvirga solisilvae TaxID=2919498 RepID=UPI001FAFBB80|nr:hypothetical protein [Microvirga solisilvae]
MVRTRKAAALAALSMLWAGPSFAEGTLCLSYGYEDPGRTVNGPIVLGRINTVSPKVHFLKNPLVDRSCPNMSSACQEKAYLVPGDEVVVIGTKGDYICASYASKQGRVTKNWLPSANVSIVQDPPPVETKDWVGQWQSGPEQSIEITQADKVGTLSIKGDASWGAGDPERVKRGAVNVGSLEGEMKPEDAMLSFGIGENGTLPFDQADEADCKVRMQRLGPYLLVKDNKYCGGNNVSFTGVYRRP